MAGRAPLLRGCIAVHVECARPRAFVCTCAGSEHSLRSLSRQRGEASLARAPTNVDSCFPALVALVRGERRCRTTTNRWPCWYRVRPGAGTTAPGSGGAAKPPRGAATSPGLLRGARSTPPIRNQPTACYTTVPPPTGPCSTGAAMQGTVPSTTSPAWRSHLNATTNPVSRRISKGSPSSHFVGGCFPHWVI